MVCNFLGQMADTDDQDKWNLFAKKISDWANLFFNSRCYYMFTGFSEAQAESLTMSLVEIITSSVLNITDSTVSKIDQVCNWPLERFINAKLNIQAYRLFT